MKPRDMALAVLVVVIWSGNFVAAKFALQTIPPLLMSALRFTIVACVLLPFVKIPYGSFRKIFFLTLTLGLLHFSLIMVGVKDLDASTCTIAVQAGVPFSVLLAGLFLKEKLFLYQLIGIGIAFTGFLILVGEPSIFNQIGPFSIVVAAAFFWAVSNLQSKSLTQVSVFSLNAWFALFTAIELFIVSFLFEEGQVEGLLATELVGFVGLSYTALMSTIVGYGLWYRLLGSYQVGQIAPFNMLSPFFGALFGVLIFNESIGWTKVIGGLIIVTGVSVLVLYKPKKQQNIK